MEFRFNFLLKTLKSMKVIIRKNSAEGSLWAAHYIAARIKT